MQNYFSKINYNGITVISKNWNADPYCDYFTEEFYKLLFSKINDRRIILDLSSITATNSVIHRAVSRAEGLANEYLTLFVLASPPGLCSVGTVSFIPTFKNVKSAVACLSTYSKNFDSQIELNLAMASLRVRGKYSFLPISEQIELNIMGKQIAGSPSP